MEQRKNKDGKISYRVMIWIDGRAIKSPFFPRKSDCNAWKADQTKLREQLKVTGSKNYFDQMSFGKYANIWLESKKAQGIAKSSYQNYESNLRVHLLPRFKTQLLQKITRQDLEKFQYELTKTNSNNGINVIMGTIRSMFQDAVRDGYILKSPTQHLRSLPETKMPDVFWTKAEIDQFLRSNCDHEYYDFFVLALNTGMRRGELAGLCWDRVNFQQRTITISRTRDQAGLLERTKTTLIRVIPMNDLVFETLSELFRRRGESNFVLLNTKNEPIAVHHIYRVFQQAQKRAGLNRFIRVHDLRHTFASQYIINGGNIYDLQKFLGHTNTAMTTRYAHHSMEYLHQAIAGFSLGTVMPNRDRVEAARVSFLNLRKRKVAQSNATGREANHAGLK